MDSYRPDPHGKTDKEDIDDNAASSPAEMDCVEELIHNIIASTPEERFITENYIFVKKTAHMFLHGSIGREGFLKVVRDLKARVIDAREQHEKAYLPEDEWTVEVAAGDRLLMEGMTGYEGALTFLEDHAYEQQEETIRLGIDMVYEANRKLVLNQCLVEYVENISSQELHLSSLLQALRP